MAGTKDPVFVLDEIDKLGPAPAAVLLEVLDPEQNDRFRDAFVELPFDLSEVLFLTTANETDRIPPALRDRLEIIDLPGYREAEKVAIAETHLVAAQNRGAGLAATPVRFTRGACRRIIRDYTRASGGSVSSPGACRRSAGRWRSGSNRRRGAGPRAHHGGAGARVPPAPRAPATRTASTVSANSWTHRRCRKPCGLGGGRSWRGWPGWRRPTPSRPAGASTCSAW